MDRYLVKVSGKAWHTGCLKCCICGLELGKEATCYTKEDKIYCKTDYARFVYPSCSLIAVSLQKAVFSRCSRSLIASLVQPWATCLRSNDRGDLIWSSDGLDLFFFFFNSCLPQWCLNHSRYKAVGKKKCICWFFILITFSGHYLPQAER